MYQYHKHPCNHDNPNTLLQCSGGGDSQLPNAAAEVEPAVVRGSGEGPPQGKLYAEVQRLCLGQGRPVWVFCAMLQWEINK